ncbi:MAG: glycosyltransferase [Pyrinomonadaceae bacterium]
MTTQEHSISVVTPTFCRPIETIELLQNLAKQSLLPQEVILVDGARSDVRDTETAVAKVISDFPFPIRYLRQPVGTAIQRNAGIELASGDLVALIDDDVRLDENFLEVIGEVFRMDDSNTIGGIVGYRTNGHFSLKDSARWRWYKRLKLLTTFEPGRYDRNCGYPINNYMQEPFEGVRQVDFMTTACAVWRREVFSDDLWFHPFFRDFGVLEDAHFSLRAGRKWKLFQCGDAKCVELNSPNGRENRRRLGYKCVVNYYFVFKDIAQPLSLMQKVRFWRYQLFEFFRIGASAIFRGRSSDLQDLVGRVEGLFAILRGVASPK